MMGAANNAGNTISSATGASVVSVIIFVVVVLVFLGIMMVYTKEIVAAWNSAKEVVTGYFDPKTPPPSADADAGAGPDEGPHGKAPDC
jgi:lipopolysaccharide export LptBFGC system permease protein LptF